MAGFGKSQYLALPKHQNNPMPAGRINNLWEFCSGFRSPTRSQRVKFMSSLWIRIEIHYLLVNIYITMENHHFSIGRSTVSMAIFNSYVSLPAKNLMRKFLWKLLKFLRLRLLADSLCSGPFAQRLPLLGSPACLFSLQSTERPCFNHQFLVEANETKDSLAGSMWIWKDNAMMIVIPHLPGEGC